MTRDLRLSRHARSRVRSGGLFGHPCDHPLGDCEFLLLGPNLIELFDQVF